MASTSNVKDTIDEICKGKANLKCSAKDLDRLDQELAVMENKYDANNCSIVVDHLFEKAGKELSSEGKEVLEGLRQMVGVAETSLYKPHSEYMDCFFFPSENNKNL